MTQKDGKNETFANQFWLDYLNDYLYVHALITEAERNQMSFLISQKPKAGK